MLLNILDENLFLVISNLTDDTEILVVQTHKSLILNLKDLSLIIILIVNLAL